MDEEGRHEGRGVGIKEESWHEERAAFRHVRSLNRIFMIVREVLFPGN